MSHSTSHHHDHVESRSLFSHDHDYSGARRNLIAALVLLLAHIVVDIVGGVLSGSRSLFAHMRNTTTSTI